MNIPWADRGTDGQWEPSSRSTRRFPSVRGEVEGGGNVALGEMGTATKDLGFQEVETQHVVRSP